MSRSTKSQLNTIYYARRLERRRTAGKALYSWLRPGDLPEQVALWLKNSIEAGAAGEFVKVYGGYRESRSTINWAAVSKAPGFTTHYTDFERCRAAARAQKNPYYRRRLAKLGIDWKAAKRPYGTEAIVLD